MILIATTMIIRSNQSQIASISQRSNYKSLAAAETGVTKFLSFLNEHRELAGVNKADFIDSRDTIQGRRDECSDYADSEEILDNLNTWIATNEDSDPKKGSYFIRDYTVSGAQATLQVDGSVSDPPGNGITRLEVKFPVDSIAPTPTPAGTAPSGSPTCNDLTKSIPVQQSLPFLGFKENSSDKLINVVNNELGPDAYPLSAIIDTNQTLPRGGDDLSKSTFTYVIDTSGTDAINLKQEQFIKIRQDKTVFLVTNGDVEVIDGYFDIGQNASLFIISSSRIILKSQEKRLPVVNRGSGFPFFHIFLTAEDNDPDNSGDVGELEVNIKERGFGFPVSVYAPFGTVDLTVDEPNSDFAFNGTVWAKKFSVSDSNEFEPLNVFHKFSPDTPSFWKSALTISDFAHSIRPVNSWKKSEVP